MANWVLMSLAILCRRSAGPNAADHGSRPLRSTRITPENPDSTASSATRSTTSAMIEPSTRSASSSNLTVVFGAGTMAQFRVITTTADQGPLPTEVGDENRRLVGVQIRTGDDAVASIPA